MSRVRGAAGLHGKVPNIGRGWLAAIRPVSYNPEMGEIAELLKFVGKALYGRQWQAPLSRDLGVTDRTIRNWAAGLGCPTDLPDRLLPILRQRGESVIHLITTLENRPAGNP